MGQDDFLAYYNTELTFLRHMGAQFAKSYPKVAGRLRLGEVGSEDPNVARLMEAFAFLTARVHQKLDDDLPEFADALLDVIYPHYQLPIPALSILQFKPPLEATAPTYILKGTEVETSPAYEQNCRFATCYDVDLYPIKINQVSLSEKIKEVPTTYPHKQQIKSILSIKLSCLSQDVTFSKISPKKIRFYINLNAPYSYKLYQLIFQNIISIAVRKSSNDSDPIIMETNCIEPVGFGQEEGLFPYPEQSFLGYRLLTEFFAFPQKFLFFDVHFADALSVQEVGMDLDILIYLKSSDAELSSILTANSLMLGCTPIVNLFEVQAEPILVDHSSVDYLVIPDARQLEEIETYQVKDVTLQTSFGQIKTCYPLYSLKPGQDSQSLAFWQTKTGTQKEFEHGTDQRRETLISFTDLNLNPLIETHQIAQLKLLCTNHSLPQKLPYGGVEPKLQLMKGDFAGSIQCLLPFTPRYRLHTGKGVRWQLISHCMLNSLPFGDSEQGQPILQEILRLYNFNNSEDNNMLIDSIESIQANHAVARCQDHYGNAVFRGTEVTLCFKEMGFSNLFLFSSVLEKFLSKYCSINSFTQLVVKYSNPSKEIMKWAPRAGSKALL